MIETVKASKIRLHAVRLWLLAAAAMIFLTLVVGGATRLTESGLSIVEWKPVTGVLPPLSESEWQAEFAKYQTIPQYRELKRGMSLDAFKVIYWWEWSHRVLARLTGAVFLLPFLFFLWRGAIPQSARAVVGYFHRWRGSWRGRLVDGFLWAHARRERFAIPARFSSFDCECDL
jgi:cytochrome c oxidase assembly protein subunit 15